ncbi:MAG: hypothetical protein ACFFDI_14775 [Promethearchaeota archaeon]
MNKANPTITDTNAYIFQDKRSIIILWFNPLFFGGILTIFWIYLISFSPFLEREMNEFLPLNILVLLVIISAIIISGLIAWLNRKNWFYFTRSGLKTILRGGSPHIILPKIGDKKYWLYKDEQLEIIQAGFPIFTNYFFILVMFSVLFVSVVLELKMVLIGYPPLNLFMVFLVILFVVGILLKTLFQVFRYNSNSKELLLSVWTYEETPTTWDPSSLPISDPISLRLETYDVRIPVQLRPERLALVPRKYHRHSLDQNFLLPMNQSIQLQLSSKTVSFSFNFTDPLPQVPRELIIFVKDISFLSTGTPETVTNRYQE